MELAIELLEEEHVPFGSPEHASSEKYREEARQVLPMEEPGPSREQAILKLKVIDVPMKGKSKFTARGVGQTLSDLAGSGSLNRHGEGKKGDPYLILAQAPRGHGFVSGAVYCSSA